MSGGSSASVAILRKSTGAANVGRGGSTVDADLTAVEADVAQNSSDISTNAGNIAANAAAISANTTAIGGKEPTQTAASQEEAEAGTGTTVRSWTPERIAQAIAALAPTPGLTPLSAAVASDDAAIDFTLPGGYNSYELRIIDLRSADDARTVFLQVSDDGGSTFDAGGTDYAYQTGYTENSTGTGDRSTGTSAVWMSKGSAVGNDANDSYSAKVRIINPSASAYTHVQGEFGQTDTSGNPISGTVYGYRAAASVVDAIRIKMNGGNIADGFFVLFGVD